MRFNFFLITFFEISDFCEILAMKYNDVYTNMEETFLQDFRE